MEQQHFIFQSFSGQSLVEQRVENCHFHQCSFDHADLTSVEFINCQFYDAQAEIGSSFYRATLKDASFKNCDLTMADFRNIHALGMEMRDCKAQGINFKGASFLNMITQRTFFCHVYLTGNNFSYANFSGVVLEKCELWENRWTGANILGTNFNGSDLSGGEFSGIDWRTANFTHCDLTNCDLTGLNIRQVELDGVKIASWQQNQLLEQIGIIVVN